MSTQDVAARFTRETAQHEMTVLHDDGLFRHLRFKAPGSSMYWFELTTVPGSLIFRGDGQSFVFARLTDMFEFFRGPVGRINPMYWAEKLTSGREEGVRGYDRDLFERQVMEATGDAIRSGDAPTGLTSAVTREVLDPESGMTDEDAHRVLHEFSFYKNDKDRYGRHEQVNDHLEWVPAKRPDFQFSDTWEWDFRDYDWWFLWSLHAIVWGIAQYDAHHAQVQAVAS